jgi:TolB-like protein/Tfp pilus assembly protein PilF
MAVPAGKTGAQGAETMATGEERETGESGPTSVFVSYARADRKAALPIIRALENAGFSVWWDGKLEGGERYLGTTEAALEGAKAVVVLWSKTSVASHWVHDEAMRGRDRRCIVPLTIDGAQPPLGFRQFQTIDLSGRGARSRKAGLDAMIHAVAALHGRSAPEPAPLQRPVGRRAFIAGGAAAAAAAGGGIAWWAGLFGGEAQARSIAVLPFDNLGGNAGRAYFSDGLAAEIRTQLARNPLLEVAAQTSSNRFRDSNDDARTISRALKVRYLLDGNVRTTGSVVRISAELIDGETGFSQWSRAFDRPLADLFAVQEEIADAVAVALAAQIDRQQSGHRGTAAAAAGGTANLTAYDSQLRGKDLFDQAIDEESDRAALAHFDAAIAADPRYALAYSARSRALTVIGNQYEQGERRRETYRLAVEAAQRGAALAPEVAETQSALGFALFNGRLDARAARGPYERSLALGRGEADILSRYALYSARCGRIAAAREAIGRSAALDPLNARTQRLIGDVEYSARRYAESIPSFRRALELNPQLSVAHSAIGAALLMMGRIDEARAEYEREPSSLFKLAGIAIVAGRKGNEAEAAGAFDRLRAEHGDNGLYQQAQILAQSARPDEAMARLLEAFRSIDSGLVYLRNDPFVDPLRRAPVFNDLLNRLGFA